MKPILTLFTALLLAPLGALHAADAPMSPVKPNVLLIIADDQGYADFGFMGNQLVKTPQLDRLAGESAVFRTGRSRGRFVFRFNMLQNMF